MDRGRTRTATEFTLSGQLQSDAVQDWVCHRARLLNLSGWVAQRDAGQITIVVAGPEPLIGAMEMACSLGPVDICVDRIDSRPVKLPVTVTGFRKRGFAGPDSD